jgi:hypothetical protein
MKKVTFILAMSSVCAVDLSVVGTMSEHFDGYGVGVSHVFEIDQHSPVDVEVSTAVTYAPFSYELEYDYTPEDGFVTSKKKLDSVVRVSAAAKILFACTEKGSVVFGPSLSKSSVDSFKELSHGLVIGYKHQIDENRSIQFSVDNSNRFDDIVLSISASKAL